jgi:hypothetical protein
MMEADPASETSYDLNVFKTMYSVELNETCTVVAAHMLGNTGRDVMIAIKRLTTLEVEFKFF